MPEHPMAHKNGSVQIHRMVAWDEGILTNPKDVVHHKDGNIYNFEPENLQAMTRAEHMRLHIKWLDSPEGLTLKEYRAWWQMVNWSTHLETCSRYRARKKAGKLAQGVLLRAS